MCQPVGRVRLPPAVALLQSFCASLAIPRPDPLGLPITHLQQLSGFSQPQLPAFTRPINSARLSCLLLNWHRPNLSPSLQEKL
jgi:hypothetical protein